jgi:hypothetical protein
MHCKSKNRSPRWEHIQTQTDARIKYIPGRRKRTIVTTFRHPQCSVGDDLREMNCSVRWIGLWVQQPARRPTHRPPRGRLGQTRSPLAACRSPLAAFSRTAQKTEQTRTGSTYLPVPFIIVRPSRVHYQAMCGELKFVLRYARHLLLVPYEFHFWIFFAALICTNYLKSRLEMTKNNVHHLHLNCLRSTYFFILY